MELFSIRSKKLVVMVCLLVFVLSFASCGVAEDKVVASLGKYEKREYFTSGGFQDYTDYAKYYYSSVEIVENPYLTKIQESDLATIEEYLDDFEQWIELIRQSGEGSEVVNGYDFRRAWIDTEDYFYIDSEEHTWSDGYTSLVNYDVYFYDTQTQVLYYFHNNI